MDPVNPSDVSLPSPSSLNSSELSTSSLLSLSTTSTTSPSVSTSSSKPTAKSRTSDQDGAAPRKRSLSDEVLFSIPLSDIPQTLDVFHDDIDEGDAEVLKIFSTFKKINMKCCLNYPLLLSTVIETFTVFEAEDMIRCEPSITGILRDGLKTGSFKEIRQLGAFSIQK
jgi:hypothetical protein